jgi:hypothetical protein
MQESELDFTSGGSDVFFTELAALLEGLLQGTRYITKRVEEIGIHFIQDRVGDI